MPCQFHCSVIRNKKVFFRAFKIPGYKHICLYTQKYPGILKSLKKNIFIYCSRPMKLIDCVSLLLHMYPRLLKALHLKMTCFFSDFDSLRGKWQKIFKSAQIDLKPPPMDQKPFFFNYKFNVTLSYGVNWFRDNW